MNIERKPEIAKHQTTISSNSAQRSTYSFTLNNFKKMPETDVLFGRVYTAILSFIILWSLSSDDISYIKFFPTAILLLLAPMAVYIPLQAQQTTSVQINTQPKSQKPQPVRQSSSTRRVAKVSDRARPSSLVSDVSPRSSKVGSPVLEARRSSLATSVPLMNGETKFKSLLSCPKGPRKSFTESVLRQRPDLSGGQENAGRTLSFGSTNDSEGSQEKSKASTSPTRARKISKIRRLFSKGSRRQSF